MFRTAVLLSTLWQLLPLSKEEDADEDPLDFGLVDVLTEPSTEEVVMGKVLLYGQVSIERREELALAARAALSVVCSPQGGDMMGMSMPVTTYVFQDILTLSRARIGLHVEFYMLPPLGGGIICIDRLSSMNIGAAEPPFEPIPASAFRSLFMRELSQNRLSRELDVSDWRVEVANITCDDLLVLKPQEFPDAGPPPSLTKGLPERQCDGKMLPEIDWATVEASAWVSAAGKCELAPTPCVCAAIAGCSWSGQCGKGDGVACQYCALRTGCEPSRAELCAAARTPCACVASAADCIWEDNVCQVRLLPDVETSCYACMRQPRCPQVQVDRLRPSPLSFMGLPEVGWFVNVTFSRQVWFTSALEGAVMLQCPTPNGQTTRLQIPAEGLSLADLTLTVNLRGVINEAQRDCDVLIIEGALRDRDHVAFGGLAARAYTITMPDTVPPALQSFDPANSAVDVGLTVPVTIIFDEAMEAGPVQDDVLLLALGAESAAGGREADVVVRRFRVDGPDVSFSDRRVVFAMEGVLQHDVLYSLSVPRGVLADRHGNGHPGLEPAVYAFRTVSEDRVLDIRNRNMSGEFVIGSIVVGAALLATCVAAGCIYARVRSLKPKVLLHGDGSTLNMPDPDAAVQWGGERVVFGSADPNRGGSARGGSVSSMDDWKRAASMSSLDPKVGSFSPGEQKWRRGSMGSQDRLSRAGSMDSTTRREPGAAPRHQLPGRREAWEGPPRPAAVGRRESSASAPEEIA